MKNILISLSLSLSLFTFTINASEYKIEINKTNYKNTISIEDYVDNTTLALTCELPEVLNETNDACIIPTPTCELPEVLNETNDGCIDSLDTLTWIDRSDSCGGIRPLTYNANIFILRANTANKISNPTIPEGYRWITTNEFDNITNVHNVYNYYSQCGFSAYPYVNGSTQREITFIDSGSTGRTAHAGNFESYTAGWSYPTQWLGIAVIKTF